MSKVLALTAAALVFIYVLLPIAQMISNAVLLGNAIKAIHPF